MLKVTVKRSRWYRGQGGSDSALLREDDRKMCCLGFVCRAARLPAKDIRGRGSPAEVYTEQNHLPNSLLALVDTSSGVYSVVDSIDCHKMMRINDSTDFTSRKRESELKKLGKKVGIAFTFVD
jgi:hypothetical protein